jgi:hypothetical protein
MGPLVRKGDVLSDEHPNAYSRHVEAIQERLNRVVDLHALPFSLVLQDTLGNCGNHTIVPPLDLLQS